MDVLTSETCWGVNKEILKQVTSSWSLFIQLRRASLQRSTNGFYCVLVLAYIFVQMMPGLTNEMSILRKICACSFMIISFMHPYKQSGRWQDVFVFLSLFKRNASCNGSRHVFCVSATPWTSRPICMVSDWHTLRAVCGSHTNCLILHCPLLNVVTRAIVAPRVSFPEIMRGNISW